MSYLANFGHLSPHHSWASFTHATDNNNNCLDIKLFEHNIINTNFPNNIICILYV